MLSLPYQDETVDDGVVTGEKRLSALVVKCTVTIEQEGKREVPRPSGF